MTVVKLRTLAFAATFVVLTLSFVASEQLGEHNEEHLSSSRKLLSTNDDNFEYCVIGGGPGGIQLAYLLQKRGLSYAVFEKSTPGSFFKKYPRHRKLISINKVYTGSSDAEFNLRHDWNSLLSDDDNMLFKHYSKHYFPHANTMVRYLEDFVDNFDLNVIGDTEIVSVVPEGDAEQPAFKLEDQKGNAYDCSYVVVATGLSVPNVPPFQGMEHSVGYEDMPVDKEFYRNKTVLIFGKANAAFETANHIRDVAASTVIAGARHHIRFAWETHYVGDIRATNNEFIDQYQLKSHDVIDDGDLQQFTGMCLRKNEVGKLIFSTDCLDEPYNVVETPEPPVFPNMDEYNGDWGRHMVKQVAQYEEDTKKDDERVVAMKNKVKGYTFRSKWARKCQESLTDVCDGAVEHASGGYEDNQQKMRDGFIDGEGPGSVEEMAHMAVGFDVVIRCLGWKFNNSFFQEGKRPEMMLSVPKFPKMNAAYESVNLPGVFYAGTLMHSRDFRKSSGGFVHGFRYMVKALANILDFKHREANWPSMDVGFNANDLMSHMTDRLANVSANYQMFGVLADVYTVRPCEKTAAFIPEVPLSFVPEVMRRREGKDAKFWTITLEYGDYTAPGEDVFRPDRATLFPGMAHAGRFVHPVLRFFDFAKSPDRVQSVHHMLEDTLTTWNRDHYHKRPLAYYLRDTLAKRAKCPWDSLTVD